MSAKDLTLDLVIRYGFQLLGAVVILGVGFVLARWIGNLTNRWLDKRVKEPSVRMLMVRSVRILVLIFTLVVALDKFGFQIAPLVAAIGELGRRMGKVRILTRCEELKLVEDQGWDPVGIIPVDSPRELDECLELSSVPQFDRAYGDRDPARHA